MNYDLVFGLDKEALEANYGVRKNELGDIVAGQSGLQEYDMFAASILSDVQEMMERGADKESVRKLLNRTKKVLFDGNTLRKIEKLEKKVNDISLEIAHAMSDEEVLEKDLEAKLDAARDELEFFKSRV